MQRTIPQSSRWRLTFVVVAGGLTVACSTYHPLDAGSSVPWAKASSPRGGATTVAGVERVVPAPATVSLPASRSRPAAAPAAVVAALPSAAALPAGRYRVQPGDRLATVASSHGISVRGLAEANQLGAPYVIYVGQVLRVPTGARPAKPAPTTVASAGDRYVVRRGETLSGIARRVDVSMAELAAANRIASPYEVYTGQKLQIPGAPARGAEVVTAKKVAAHQAGSGDAPPLSGHGFLWPVNGKVIGGFGPTGEGQRRDGIDIAAREGAPVLAAEDGIVAYAGDGIRGYGRLILVRHAEGYITTYGHNAALLVEVGDVVERGQVIARVGSTGEASRSQLHFELRKGRKPLDPETVLVREPTAVASSE